MSRPGRGILGKIGAGIWGVRGGRAAGSKWYRRRSWGPRRGSVDGSRYIL